MSSVQAQENFALEFDGSAHAIAQDAPSLDLTENMTVEVWVKFADESSGCIAATHIGNQPCDGTWAFYNSGAVDQILNYDRCGCDCDYFVDSTVPAPIGEWIHVAVTYDDATDLATFYLNGVPAGSHVTDKYVLDTPYDLWVGQIPNTFIRLTGSLDELRLWNVARSEVELQGTMFVQLTGSEPGLVGYWPFNEGGGQVATDLSPFGNDLTLGDNAGVEGDDPQWVQSGAPVPISPSFIRGDCNGLGSLELTDPYYALAFLFQGANWPQCEDACDANDDGLLDVSDPIRLLGAMFLGEPPPGAPWPFCGVDPAPAGADDLGCDEYPVCP